MPREDGILLSLSQASSTADSPQPLQSLKEMSESSEQSQPSEKKDSETSPLLLSYSALDGIESVLKCLVFIIRHFEHHHSAVRNISREAKNYADEWEPLAVEEKMAVLGPFFLLTHPSILAAADSNKSTKYPPLGQLSPLDSSPLHSLLDSTVQYIYTSLLSTHTADTMEPLPQFWIPPSRLMRRVLRECGDNTLVQGLFPRPHILCDLFNYSHPQPSSPNPSPEESAPPPPPNSPPEDSHLPPFLNPSSDDSQPAPPVSASPNLNPEGLEGVADEFEAAVVKLLGVLNGEEHTPPEQTQEKREFREKDALLALLAMSLLRPTHIPLHDVHTTFRAIVDQDSKALHNLQLLEQAKSLQPLSKAHPNSLNTFFSTLAKSQARAFNKRQAEAFPSPPLHSQV